MKPKSILITAILTCLSLGLFAQSRPRDVYVYYQQYLIVRNIMAQKWVVENVKNDEKNNTTEFVDWYFSTLYYMGSSDFDRISHSDRFTREFYDGGGWRSPTTAGQAADFRRNRYGLRREHWADVDRINVTLTAQEWEIEWVGHEWLRGFRNVNYDGAVVVNRSNIPTSRVKMDARTKAVFDKMEAEWRERMAKAQAERARQELKAREEAGILAMERILRENTIFLRNTFFGFLVDYFDPDVDLTTHSNEKILTDALPSGNVVDIEVDNDWQNRIWYNINDDGKKWAVGSDFAGTFCLFRFGNPDRFRYKSADTLTFSWEWSNNTMTLTQTGVHSEFVARCTPQTYTFDLNPKELYIPFKKHWDSIIQQREKVALQAEEARLARLAEEARLENERFLAWERSQIQTSINHQKNRPGSRSRHTCIRNFKPKTDAKGYKVSIPRGHRIVKINPAGTYLEWAGGSRFYCFSSTEIGNRKEEDFNWYKVKGNQIIERKEKDWFKK